MDYAGSRPTGRAVRERVLDRLDRSAPLTIIEGLPGVGKQALIRQRAEQLRARRGADARRVVCIEFPQTPVGDAQALALAAEQFAEQVGQDLAQHAREDPRIDRLLRGRADLARFERDLPTLLHDWAGTQICLVAYEWQASPTLDRIIIAMVRSGVDVLCSLLDASGLRATASVARLSLTVIGDGELVFRDEEIGMLAAYFGMRPTAELIGRVHELTAGHPLATAMTLLRVAGVERMISDGDDVRVVIGGVERDWGSAVDLQTPAPETRAHLREVSAAQVGRAQLVSAVGMMRYATVGFLELLRAPQGESPFLRVMAGLIAVSSADLDALEEVLPGALHAVDRLRAAGYVRLEYRPSTGGLFHWHEGMRTVIREWSRSLPHRNADTAAEFVTRLVGWYGEHGRPEAAVALLQDVGGPAELETFVTAHFTDMIWTRRVHGFAPMLALSDERRAELPMCTILAALESYRTIREDPGLTRRAMLVFPILEDRMRNGTPPERLRSALGIVVGCAALDLWESHGEAVDIVARATAEALHRGLCTGGEAGRTDLIVGTIAIIRGDLTLARTLLLRALAEGTDEQGRLVARLGISVLEGYFAQQLLPDDARLPDVTETEMMLAGDDLSAWGSVAELAALARSWNAVWHGDYRTGLDVIRHLVLGQDRVIVQPFVSWSYSLQLLLAGQADEALGVWSEVARRKSEKAPVPGRNLLGHVLAALAAGRPGEAVDLIEPHKDDLADPLVRLARAVVDSGTGRPVSTDELVEGTSLSLVPRARTLLQTLTALQRLQADDADGAVALLNGVEATSSSGDIEFALRFASRRDVVEAMDRIGSRLSETLRIMLSDAVDVPHVLTSPIPLARLTQTERQVLVLVAEGLTNRDIAERMYLSVNTVKTHLTGVYRKLRVNGRHAAAEAARNAGLV
jgi:DNA-binding CsgD family transcriptional regulator